ncbi:MAG: hypothetical protein HY376_01090 [Candidatus Blackburnbacteria bacterium]|nr:hypothetical protein [Candidatus Blackburnbacteria bacterium]
MAQGSLLEIESHAEVALAVGYWKSEQFDEFELQRKRTGYFLFKYKASVDG